MLANEIAVFTVVRQLPAERIQCPSVPQQRAQADAPVQACPEAPIVFHCPPGAKFLAEDLH